MLGQQIVTEILTPDFAHGDPDTVVTVGQVQTQLVVFQHRLDEILVAQRRRTQWMTAGAAAVGLLGIGVAVAAYRR